MKNIPITMIRPHLRDIPDVSLPPGYSIRPFKAGSEQLWKETAVQSGLFQSIEQAAARYEQEFAQVAAQLEDRCFFLLHGKEQVIGTAMAWYHPDYLGECYGRIHWVGIIPQFQGRGLAKPLLAAAMHRLAQNHDKAYLTSQTTSYKAICMYLDFGFVPWMQTDHSEEAWALLRKWTNHPSLIEDELKERK